VPEAADSKPSPADSRSSPIDLGSGTCPDGSGPFARAVLLRKEVIQPHLPIRLPCYDFIPVTSFTFGASLPCGLGGRLRVLPASVI
jgi:hypothetical protein